MSTAAEAIFSLSLLKKEHFVVYNSFFTSCQAKSNHFAFRQQSVVRLLEFSQNCVFGSLPVDLEAVIWRVGQWKVLFALKSKRLVKMAFILNENF